MLQSCSHNRFLLSSGGGNNYGGPSGNDGGYGNRPAPYQARNDRGGRGRGGGRGGGRGQMRGQ